MAGQGPISKLLAVLRWMWPDVTLLIRFGTKPFYSVCERAIAIDSSRRLCGAHAACAAA